MDDSECACGMSNLTTPARPKRPAFGAAVERLPAAGPAA
jgi:hypothetical protein